MYQNSTGLSPQPTFFSMDSPGNLHFYAAHNPISDESGLLRENSTSRSSSRSSSSSNNSAMDYNSSYSSSSPSTSSTDLSKPNLAITSVIKDTKGTVVKRNYSHNGCIECKKRRMKCDETKPTCWQCSRLNRQCIYLLNQKKNAKKKKPVKQQRQRQRRQRHSVDTALISKYDTNLLIQNLNDMVNMKLNDSTYQELKTAHMGIPDYLPTMYTTPDNTNSSSCDVGNVPLSLMDNVTIHFDLKLQSLKLGGIHEKYLKVFYHDCMDSIAPFFQNQNNPLRDIILSFAQKESYLLSAILAVGASISYRQNGDVKDEQNYCKYLSNCLRLLKEQLQIDSNVLSKIEPIILTVIILAWDCIYIMNSQWRLHLRGVIELFQKINVSGQPSKIINLAKCWFKIMEYFAHISTSNGGSLDLVEDDADIDLIFNPWDTQYTESLRNLNIITPLNEFNLLRGHREDFDLVLKEVIKALNAVRPPPTTENASHVSNEQLPWNVKRRRSSTTDNRKTYTYFEIQRNILVPLENQLQYEFIDKSGIIPTSNELHPANSHVQDNAIDLIVLSHGETLAISWYDISHQTQVLSVLLIVLLKLLRLPRDSDMVQQVVQKIMSFFKFLQSYTPPVNTRTCYSNFAVFLAGINAIDEETRDLVRLYYKVNGTRFSKLNEYNLSRLEDIWAHDGSSKKEEDIFTW